MSEWMAVCLRSHIDIRVIEVNVSTLALSYESSTIGHPHGPNGSSRNPESIITDMMRGHQVKHAYLVRQIVKYALFRLIGYPKNV